MKELQNASSPPKGTQRIVRRICASLASEMIATGKSVNPIENAKP